MDTHQRDQHPLAHPRQRCYQFQMRLASKRKVAGPQYYSKLALAAVMLIFLVSFHGYIGANSAGCTINYYDENMQVQSIFALPPTPVGNFDGSLVRKLVQDRQLEKGNSSPAAIGLECQNIAAEDLHEQFNLAKSLNLKLVSLTIKDSNLSTLSNLPQGLDELKKLVISNTSIDLELLKEGSESLDQLSTLEISNEKISNIPQNFFQEMSSLKELRLENNGIASLDSDAFHNLDDSLEFLGLRNNRFNRFPMAVKNLAGLSILDLSDNDIVIDLQESDLPEKLEQLLNLAELHMNRINCTCEFGQSPFYEWIARTHISGLRCYAPEKLKSQEVIVFERDEFCAGTSGAQRLNHNDLNLLPFLLASLLSFHILKKR